MVMVVEVDPDPVEDADDGEPEADALDDWLEAIAEELEDDGAKEEEVDQRPDIERVAGRGQVRDLFVGGGLQVDRGTTKCWSVDEDTAS